MCFLVTFCTTQKVTIRSLSGKLRGFANLESAHRSRSFAPQQLKPFKGVPRYCKPRISAQNNNLAQTKLNLFAALVGISFRQGRCYVAAATIPAASRLPRRLCRLVLLPAATPFAACDGCLRRQSRPRDFATQAKSLLSTQS